MLATGEPHEPSQAESMQTLVADMRAGQFDALIMIGVNPVYSASPDLNFVDALQGVSFTLHLGTHVDETARVAHWHVPRSHYLEAWGDGRAYDGTVSIIQPLIAPLYEQTRSEVELLDLLAGGDIRPGYDIVRLTWQNQMAGGLEDGWRRAIHDGFLPESGFAASGGGGGGEADLAIPVSQPDDIELVFRLDPTVLDGSFANNAWMQEIPDPATKLVWDNVAIMSPATAERLGLRSRYSKGVYRVDLVRLAANGREVELPIWIMPGHAENSVTVNLGYGREIGFERELRNWHIFDLDHKIDVYNQGPIANGVGKNVSVLRSAAMEHVIPVVQVEKVAGTYTIVTTQEHGSMEGRPLIRRASMEEYRQHPTFAPDAEPLVPTGEPFHEYPELWASRHPSDQPAYRDNLYFPNQWGMSIDLNACTGCNACIVACVSENNIPVVGKTEVGRGRQMHWMRLDRYFVSREGSEDEPEMLVQPMLCQHCENAPCESVCPVAATIHSPDGTNQMIYNRCIGTRYCSNNCPFKVRKFNFFAWTKVTPESAQMAYNPNVTVRSRGVMEKCSWCIQRIRRGQQRARLENRTLRDGDIKTACQQVCPADAIAFGDLNDPTSRVVAEKRQNRRYEMLAYLNVKPRLNYLGRVTNPNPNLTRTEA
jgi:Fe-S-cluster-containing dehydrogenase component